MLIAITKASRHLKFALAIALVGAFGMTAAGDAEAGSRNESRWFLQNVCMANAVELLGKPEWVNYKEEAKAARKRLKSRGVPEAHLKEMESFATKIIRSTTTPENVAEGPGLCIQWYKT